MIIKRVQTILLALLVLLVGACSQLRELTPEDRQYFLLPRDIAPYPFTGYTQKQAWGKTDYLLFTKLDLAGFRGIYGTILTNTQGKEAEFLCIVQVLPSPDDAREMYNSMTPEPQPREFGREMTVSPEQYHADAVYLYAADSGYFHLIVKSARTVYSVLVEGVVVNEQQLRQNLQAKLDFIRRNERFFG